MMNECLSPNSRPSACDAAKLQERILAAIALGSRFSDAAFNELALDVYRFQHENTAFYRRFCSASGAPEPCAWQNIPAVPAAAFKRAQIGAFPPEHAAFVFETSGTTEGSPGRHYLPDLILYEAAVVPNFDAHLMCGWGSLPMHVLMPPPCEAPHSSLVRMIEILTRHFSPESCGFHMRSGELDTNTLILECRNAARDGQPIFLLGTAFAFIWLLDALAAQRMAIELPPGSRIMDTGGFKGRTREIPREEFYIQLSQALGIPLTHIVNEYGMTELLSQFYDLSLAEGAPSIWKSAPAWTRVAAVDPLTHKPLPDGQPGLLRIWDLANLYSVLAIQTEDVGICQAGRFTVLGRVAQAEPRGCSLATEDFLRRVRA